jgi:hypothetical protein
LIKCHFSLYSVQVKELQNPDDVFDTILGLVVRLAEHGLIHCDFNEFNIMVLLLVPFISSHRIHSLVACKQSNRCQGRTMVVVF